MAAILGGGEEALGQLGQFPLEQWFFEMPPCTRYWATATVITSVLVQCKVITPFQLFYSFRAVYYKSQVSGPPCQIQSFPVLSRGVDNLPSIGDC